MHARKETLGSEFGGFADGASIVRGEKSGEAANMSAALSKIDPTEKRYWVVGANVNERAAVAEAVAAKLQKKIRRVNLQEVMGKYLEETERNLNRILAEAEKTGAILFFDEADALFGKRTPVQDSHDRYANLTADGFAQIIQRYNGVVIVASDSDASSGGSKLDRWRWIQASKPTPTPKR